MSLTQRDPQTSSCDSSCNGLCAERRQCDRWDVEGTATAFELTGQRFGLMHALRILDYSQDGMGAISVSEIAPGAVVSIGFQSPGRLARRGTVTRCAPHGDGYHIGIQFDSRLAA